VGNVGKGFINPLRE